MWERELKKIKALYETRLRNNQQKASKMEASLLNQTFQVSSAVLTRGGVQMPISPQTNQSEKHSAFFI